MPVKINLPTKKKSIPLCNLRKGQIAVIVDWTDTNALGKVVQRSGDDLFIIGSEIAFFNKFSPINDKLNKMCFVEVLENGTTLTIINNE